MRRHLRFLASTAISSLALSGFVVAGTAQAQSLATQESTASAPHELGEIIVTAGKREEALSKIGGGISAYSGEALEARNADSLADYIAFVPGVALQSNGTAGYGSVSIRGISPQSVGATTATYIDDIPYGPTSALTRGAQFTLDLDPTDLARVEVLKGPQGSLYGASSMGGVLKYVTRSPSLRNREASFGQELFSYDGGGIGYKLRASGSTPLIEDKLAARLSGFYRHSDGFIEDIGFSGRGANSSADWGGRLTVLYTPTDTLRIRLNAVVQDIDSDGYGVVDYDVTTMQPKYGDLRQRRYLREPFTSKTNLYSGEVEWTLPRGTLISATSYSKLDTAVSGDSTDFYQAAYSSFLPGVGPNMPARTFYDGEVEKKTQELRFTSDRIGALEFIVGGYYTDEDLLEHAGGLLMNPNGQVSSNPLNPVQDVRRGGTLKELAAFANATYYFTEDFDVTAGARYSKIDQTRFRRATGILANRTNPAAITFTEMSFSEKADTYLLAARWRPAEGALIYARAASGYRPGGGRTVPVGAPEGFPDFFTSDELWSYELGTKLRSPNGRLAVDLSGFWIDWSNIQTLEPVVVNGVPNTIDGNAGSAVSRGFELQVDYALADGLNIGANTAYTNAEFTETIVQMNIRSGDRLYYVPEWTAAAYIDYRRPVSENAELVLSADYQYRSNQLDVYKIAMPSYSLVNVRGGIEFGNAKASLYVQNVFDERGLVGSSGLLSFGEYSFSIVQPRTIGFSLSQKF